MATTPTSTDLISKIPVAKGRERQSRQNLLWISSSDVDAVADTAYVFMVQCPGGIFKLLVCVTIGLGDMD